MKKLTHYIFIGILLALSACDQGAHKAGDNAASNNPVDVSTVSIDSVKVLDTSKIPSYTFLDPQGDNNNAVPMITSTNNANCTALPTTIADLNSGAEFNLYTFNQSTSASASGMGFNGTIGAKELLIVQDYVRWVNTNCDGATKKYGIGIRCFIHVKSAKGKLEGSLSGIAASVELGRANATFNIKALGFGIDGSVISAGLSPAGEYNVENFSKLAVLFNETLKTLNANTTMSINPVELP